ncbi:hypothetical protein [Rhizobium halophytocola]|uniref:Secreted protein n=1 Tax=Rhizobium halophytocola TaxID=735519 RepID=A0ABS4E3C3_9HYPH|nr:hypothetical protein [Rhizobium halophytocola]MBP1852446.1 hypothetical protein [Rhizobium halophytocola]
MLFSLICTLVSPLWLDDAPVEIGNPRQTQEASCSLLYIFFRLDKVARRMAGCNLSRFPAPSSPKKQNWWLLVMFFVADGLLTSEFAALHRLSLVHNFLCRLWIKFGQPAKMLRN